ncbi:hypothetical protein [Nocardia neocaledoniensis]|uniref:hypothetical protein n=1 Tax=Nocardia neocaledoniensis TaxID=236511 RepID=UPI002455527E|nr:hypothetical protein [Nocardia neocaledoniensis]
MGETLLAVPSEIAGLGNLTNEVGADANNAANFIGQHGQPADWLHGPIIDDLIRPFIEVANATKVRMALAARTTQDTGTELNKAAWMYHDQDQQNYDALNSHTMYLDDGQPSSSGVERSGITQQYDGAATYNKPKKFELKEPQANKEDTAELIGQIAPTLKDVNDTIKDVARMAGKDIDPLGMCLDKIPGNWSEIRRIGEAHKAAGNGMEACGDNLESGMKQVDRSWNGKAALSFNDWANKQIPAMKWEGPVGRVVSDAFGVVANEIREAIRVVLTKLWDVIESQVDFSDLKGAFKTVFRKVPIVGTTYELVSLGLKFAEIVQFAVDAVKKIKELVDKVIKLLDFLKDPVEGGKQMVDDYMAPVMDKVADATHKAAIAQDLAKISQVNDTLNSPDTGYEIGSGTQPWADA